MKSKVLCLCLLMLLLSACAKPAPYAPPPSPYGPEDFSYEQGFATCTKANAVVGIDVSSHQGRVDWQAVAAAGVEFAYVRIGYRGYDSGQLNTDAQCLQNLREAREAGIAVGGYFFSQAICVEEAKAEAAYALEVLQGFSLDLPLVFDWEYVDATARTAQVDRRTLTDCTLAFCQAVEEAGYQPMVYCNTDQVKNRLFMQELEGYPWWVAKYDPNQSFPCRADVWQYSDKGVLPGISEKVDLNLMFTEYGLGAKLTME